MAFQSCCFCFTLSTGCIIIGALGLLFDITLVRLIGWKWCVIDAAMNALMITGAAMQKHLCLLPWMVFNTLVIFVEWICILGALFFRSLLSSLLSAASGEAAKIPENANENVSGQIDALKDLTTTILVFIVILLALFAGIHSLLVKVVFDHFNELREKERRGQFQPSVLPNAFMNMSSIVSQPIAASAPATVYKPDLPCV